MSSKGQDPLGGDALHSSAAAFEVRHQEGTVKGGFTRRCGRRAPTDKRPCMFMFGHDGRHAWESADTPHGVR
jgi:hypothetical protein